MFRVYMYPSRLKSVRLCRDEWEQYIEAACSLIRSMGPVVRQRRSRRLYSRQSTRSKVKALMMSEVSLVMSLADSEIHQSTLSSVALPMVDEHGVWCLRLAVTQVRLG